MTWATERLNLLTSPDAPIPPVVSTLRLGTLSTWGPGWIQKRWTPDAALASADGTLFGGYLAALADQAMAFAAMTVVGEAEAFRTLNLQLNFIRVCRMQPLDIEAHVVDQTRTMILTRMSAAKADGARVFEATAQQILQPFPTTPSGG